jgi:uncharacterized protein with PQ loop repeat
MIGKEPDAISFILVMYPMVTSFPAYLPQIIRILKRKSSEDISIASWWVWLSQWICDILYALVYSIDMWFLISRLLGTILCAVTLIIAIKYRKKK